MLFMLGHPQLAAHSASPAANRADAHSLSAPLRD